MFREVPEETLLVRGTGHKVKAINSGRHDRWGRGDRRLQERFQIVVNAAELCPEKISRRTALRIEVDGKHAMAAPRSE